MDTIESLDPYLQPGIYVDSDHPAVIDFAQREAAGAGSPREVAVKLFYAVRDQVRYDLDHIDLSVGGLKASHCLATGHGFCITKAALLAAVQPAPTKALYFVARGDGTSQFSATLEEHNRAVNKFQRGQK